MIRKSTDDREFGLLHWGLIPSWADDPDIGNRMINARAETLAEKPAEEMEAYPSSTLVKSPAIDRAGCIEPTPRIESADLGFWFTIRRHDL